jgi:hypothetical protein
MNHRIGPLSVPSTTTAVAALRRLGFWGSILLPAAYLPVLYGMGGSERTLAVLGLLAVNVACLIAGHQYQS